MQDPNNAPSLKSRERSRGRRGPRRSIGPQEYCDLVLSRRKLERSDDVWTGARGLYDPETGTLYWVADSELRQGLRAASPAL